MLTHEIVISAPRSLIDTGAPAILQRSDDDFIDAVMEEFKTENGRVSLKSSLAKTRDPTDTLKLFQPIQRQFHVAILEVFCEMPGKPRLDPARIDSAGMVIRRIRGDQHEGWMQTKGRLRGWANVGRLGRDRSDPSGALRVAATATGVKDIDRSLQDFALESPDALLNEHIVPLFAAPPEVCAATKQTLYYGLVPTTSPETSESPVSFEDPTFTAASDEFRLHLVQALRGEQMEFALAGENLRPDWYEAVELTGAGKPRDLPQANWDALTGTSDSAKTTMNAMKRFILLLRQLNSEFGVFDESIDSEKIINEIKEIHLPLKLREGEQIHRTTRADLFLKNAVAILLQRDATVAATEMPLHWPALDSAHARRLADALYQAMAQRFATMKGQPGRFDERGVTYALRAFVRLKPERQCPPKILWSAYSEAFVIAPWYEGAGAAPAQIVLPDVTEPGVLKALKPNVAFVVPPKLQSLFNVSPKDMLDGKGKLDSSVTLGWICGFNIPTITICAFIVLNIFLSLLDLIFGWLFSVKICVPFPKKK